VFIFLIFQTDHVFININEVQCLIREIKGCRFKRPILVSQLSPIIFCDKVFLYRKRNKII